MIKVRAIQITIVLLLVGFVGNRYLIPKHPPATANSQNTPTTRNSDDDTSVTPGADVGDVPSGLSFYSAKNPRVSTATPDAIDESMTPAGRYRNTVFTDVADHRDIAYKSTYLTKITDNEGVLSLDFDTDQPIQHKLNIYTPSGDPLAKRPLLIFMYGGAWTYGDRNQREPEAIYYAKLGYVTMTFDYTVLPKDGEGNGVDVPSDQNGVFFPLISDGVADIHAAYQYMVDHAYTYGIDTKRIGVGGWSVGGMMSNAWVHTNATATPYGVKASLPASSIFPNVFGEAFGGFRTFNASYNPVSLFASYQDDHEQDGPYSPDTDCAQLDAIGHSCSTIFFPGDHHDISFHESPLLDPAVDFFARSVAGF